MSSHPKDILHEVLGTRASELENEMEYLVEVIDSSRDSKEDSIATINCYIESVVDNPQETSEKIIELYLQRYKNDKPEPYSPAETSNGLEIAKLRQAVLIDPSKNVNDEKEKVRLKDVKLFLETKSVSVRNFSSNVKKTKEKIKKTTKTRNNNARKS